MKKENNRLYSRWKAYFLHKIHNKTFRVFTDEDSEKIYWVFDGDNINKLVYEYNMKNVDYNYSQAEYDSDFRSFLDYSFAINEGLQK